MGQTASPYPKLKRPATYDFLSTKPKPWRIVDIHGDLEAVRALEDAEEELGRAELAAKSNPSVTTVPDAHKKVDRARQKVEATTQQMLVAGIGRKAKRALLDDERHQPREEDHQSVQDQTGNTNARAQFNEDTYPPALIAASLVEPKLSEDEVVRLVEEWSDGEYLTLWLAVLGVNQDSALVSPGKASLNGSNGTNGSTKN